MISNGGIGSDVLKATFGHMQSEEIEGYACDLYYKLITIIVCTKWFHMGSDSKTLALMICVRGDLDLKMGMTSSLKDINI